MTPAGEVRLEAFDPVRDADRLIRWLSRPHVARWWGEAAAVMQQLLARPTDRQAIITVDGTPVGYLCWERPDPGDLEAAGLSDLPGGLVDIDIMIGEAEFAGRGVGPAALTLLVSRLRDDPENSLAGAATSVANARALRALEKAGFRPWRDFHDADFGPCRYLVRPLAGATGQGANGGTNGGDLPDPRDSG